MKAHTIRTPDGGEQSVVLNAASAIRAFCTECMGFTGNPKDCTSTLCPLFVFRGKSMAYLGKREMPEEQRQAMAARLAAVRAARNTPQ